MVNYKHDNTKGGTQIMKNKKGFTLVEIIIVIALLITIAGMFAMNMVSTLNKNRKEENEKVTTEIISAADAYVSINPDKVAALYNGSGFVEIEVGELRDAGFLSETLKDAETGEIIPDDRIVKVRVNIEGDFYFEYPVERTEDSLQLIANDLYIPHDPNTDSNTWCNNKANTFLGLYHAGNSEQGLFLEEANGTIYGYGTISYNDYFNPETIDLKVQDCNVNPKKAGTYNITYTYRDIISDIERKKNRVVQVESNSNDVVSFTAKFVPTNQLIRYAPDEEIEIQITEIHKDSKTPYSFTVTVADLPSKGYVIDNLSTEEETQVPKYAIVSRTTVNSDGTTPQNQRVPYTVVPNEFTLTMDADGGVFSDGTSKKTKIVSYKEAYGTLQTPTRVGHTYNGWFTSRNGRGDKITETSIVRILHAHSIYASWTPNKYSLKIVNGNSSYGSVDKTDMEIVYNSSNTFQVTPYTGYQVASVSCTSGYTASGYNTTSTSTQTVTVKNQNSTSNGTCTVNFKKAEYPVTISTGTGGSSNRTSISVPYKDTNTFVVTPNAGYYVSNISCTNGYTASGYNSSSTSSQTIQVKNPGTTSGSTCSVSFAKRTYTVSISTSSGGSASRSSLSVRYGESSTVTVTPSTGYYLSSISCSNGYTTSYSSGSISSQVVSIRNANIANNSTCSVNFAKRNFSVSISNNYGGYSNTSSLQVPYSGSASVLVTPYSGYAINSVSCTSGYYANYSYGATYSSYVTINNTGTTSSGSCTVSYKQATYSVGIYSAGGGSVSKTSATIYSNGTTTFTATPGYNYKLSSVSCSSGYSASYTPGATYSQTVTIRNNSYNGSGSCTVFFEQNATTINAPASEDMCYILGKYKIGYTAYNGSQDYSIQPNYTWSAKSCVPSLPPNGRTYCPPSYGTFSYGGHSGCTVTDTYSCSRGNCNTLTWHWGRKGARWMLYPGCSSNMNCSQTCSAVLSCTS